MIPPYYDNVMCRLATVPKSPQIPYRVCVCMHVCVYAGVCLYVCTEWIWSFKGMEYAGEFWAAHTVNTRASTQLSSDFLYNKSCQVWIYNWPLLLPASAWLHGERSVERGNKMKKRRAGGSMWEREMRQKTKSNQGVTQVNWKLENDQVLMHSQFIQYTMVSFQLLRCVSVCVCACAHICVRHLLMSAKKGHVRSCQWAQNPNLCILGIKYIKLFDGGATDACCTPMHAGTQLTNLHVYTHTHTSSSVGGCAAALQTAVTWRKLYPM